MRNRLVARQRLIINSLSGRTRVRDRMYTIVSVVMKISPEQVEDWRCKPKSNSASASVSSYGLPMAI
ncbi:hypothetical protein ACFX13_004274 [Malus domestica]